MRPWSDIAHTQQSENKTRSSHLAACAAHARAQLRTHDRRSAGGEAPRPIERERHQKDCCARAPSEIAVRAVLDFAAPIDRRCPPLAAPRCGRTLGMRACRGSVLRTWAHISPLRSSTRTSSMRAMRGPFKHSQQQKWGTRGKGGGAGHRAHRRNAQRGRVVQNARARGRGSRSERSLGCSSCSLSSTACGTGHDFMFS